MQLIQEQGKLTPQTHALRVTLLPTEARTGKACDTRGASPLNSFLSLWVQGDSEASAAV